MKKCRYCDFYSITDLSAMPVFVDALIAEMDMAAASGAVAPGLRFDTLYFGGGTPSILDPNDIRRIIDAAAGRFTFQPDVEITLEANPGAADAEKLSGCRRAGVNRINLGVQSFRDETLRFLGRIHTAAQARLSLVHAEKAGFDRIGLDLICGLPGQSISAWRAEMEDAVQREPAHLSCYMLTCEPGTPLHADLQAGRFTPLAEEDARDLFMETLSFLEANKYLQYEISNFARSTGFRSRHNMKYWENVSYLGFGPSAHSHIAGTRWWNVASVNGYVSAIRNRTPPVADTEILTREQKIIEAVYLGLRKTEGIDIVRFDRAFGMNFFEAFAPILPGLVDAGLIQTETRSCRLTRPGMALLDSVAALFVDQAFTG